MGITQPNNALYYSLNKIKFTFVIYNPESFFYIVSEWTKFIYVCNRKTKKTLLIFLWREVLHTKPQKFWPSFISYIIALSSWQNFACKAPIFRWQQPSCQPLESKGHKGSWYTANNFSYMALSFIYTIFSRILLQMCRK